MTGKLTRATVAAIGSILIFASAVFASSQSILGDSVTSTSQINFPPVAAGPGHVLPDSPLFPIDQVYQKLKLGLAFSPERKAYVHTLILGERMAELRIMFARNNMSAINLTLNQIADEARSAAAALAEASAQGKNTQKLAKYLNDTVAEYRKVLKQVDAQSADELALHLQSTSESLLAAKMRAEDSLSEVHLAEAVQNDLDEQTDVQVLGLSTAATKLQRQLDVLERQASRTAEQENNSASGSANKNKRMIMKDFLQRKSQLLEMRKKKLQAAKEAAQKAREATQIYKQAKEAEKELNNLPPVTPTQNL